MTLEVKGVNDGSLVIQPTGDPVINTTHTASSTGINWEVDWDTYSQDQQGAFQGVFSLVIDRLKDNLLYALQNTHKLVLPAAGNFLMKDAIFNHRGDLMCSLYYNGYTTVLRLLYQTTSDHSQHRLDLGNS